MPLPIRQDDLLLRLIKDVNDIQQALRRVVANLPLYDISNENTPPQITANQNNYVPGNFDVLRLSTDAPRTITGFRGGVKGRFLTLFNVGAFEITISKLSVLSLLGNRVYSTTGSDIILNAGGQLVLYYDITNGQWISSYATSADRIGMWLLLAAPFSVPNAAHTPITWSSVVKDTSSFFDPLNPTIATIPETGWYDVDCTLIYDINATGQRESHLVFSASYGIPDSRLAVVGAPTYVSLAKRYYLLKGSTLYVTVWQNTAAPLNINPGGTHSYTTLQVSKA